VFDAWLSEKHSGRRRGAALRATALQGFYAAFFHFDERAVRAGAFGALHRGFVHMTKYEKFRKTEASSGSCGRRRDERVFV
jgi:hypothetical protein